ncbi:hypothetical protein OPQ81_010474 [Rhizoctonia solani]|nr:hypothetical protein OPQ81_010474 [Rhizoctonia solani]
MSEFIQTAWVSRPIGGIPASEDLAPSIVFAVLYALLLPNIIYNFFIRKPRAWNVIQISTVLFAVERIAWCIIRAVQAAYPEKRASAGLTSYVQTTVGLGIASTGVVLALQGATVLISLASAYMVKEVNRMRCFELAGLTLLIMPVPIYRLCVLGIRTINIFIPLSYSTRTLFYVLHLVPEWVCVTVLLGTNVRARFGTGKWGDYEIMEKARDKRLKKAEEAKQLQQNPVNQSEAV